MIASPDYATNLRRLMARQGLTLSGLIARSGLNQRTLKAILRGSKRPQPRTLHRLAAGLGVPVDELFQDPALLAHRLFDRATNHQVEEVIQANPRLFRGWTEQEFDELYSRFGSGGALTDEGTLEVVRAMNRRREVQRQVALVLETAEAELLAAMVDLLYRRVIVRPDGSAD